MPKAKLDLLLKKEKEISFSKYMEFILFDKECGLYENQEILGKEGHFITSPLVSKHFSQCIAKHYINESIFENIVELGGGEGTLACDLLLYLKEREKLPKKYIFFEKSDYLMKKQKSIINEKSISELVNVSWVSNLKDLPSEAFIVSNELFDCIPTDIIKYVDNDFQKAYVNEDYEIVWTEFDFKSESATRYLGLPKDLPQNYIFEYSYGQKCIINDISRVLNKSCFVIFDYGYAASELYLKDRMLGTLTCIKNHITDFNPLSDVGMKDVSAFVNFTYINNVFTSNSWETEAFMNQANYLLSFDILNDIDISNHDEMNDIKKLIMPNLMGELFKVLVMKKNMHKTDKNYFMKNDIIKL